MFSAECLSLHGTLFGLQSRLCGETYLGEKDTESNSTLLSGSKEEEAILEVVAVAVVLSLGQAVLGGRARVVGPGCHELDPTLKMIEDDVRPTLPVPLLRLIMMLPRDYPAKGCPTYAQHGQADSTLLNIYGRRSAAVEGGFLESESETYGQNR